MEKGSSMDAKMKEVTWGGDVAEVLMGGVVSWQTSFDSFPSPPSAFIMVEKERALHATSKVSEEAVTIASL